MEALATYQQVRQHLKGTRLRRKVDAKGGGKRARPKGGRPFGQPAGKGKKGSQQTCEARRVHVQQLKLRTRCRACGQVGHWSKECRKRPLTSSSQQGASSTGRSSTSFYWSGDSPTCAERATFFTFG